MATSDLSSGPASDVPVTNPEPATEAERDEVITDLVQTDALEVFDKEGRRRVFLGMGAYGGGTETPCFALFDADGRERISLRLDFDDNPLLLFRDPSGNAILTASTDRPYGEEKAHHGGLSLGLGEERVIEIGVRRIALLGMRPSIRLNDPDGDQIVELGGETEKATSAPYHFRVMVVEPFCGSGRKKWLPDAVSNVPPYGKIVEVIHDGTEEFEEAASHAEGYNAAQLERKNDNGEVERWAVVIPPDTAVAIGDIGRRRPATFSAQ